MNSSLEKNLNITIHDYEKQLKRHFFSLDVNLFSFIHSQWLFYWLIKKGALSREPFILYIHEYRMRFLQNNYHVIPECFCRESIIVSPACHGFPPAREWRLLSLILHFARGSYTMN